MVRIHARVILALILLLALCSATARGRSPHRSAPRWVDRVVKILRDPDLKGDKRADERRTAITKVADEMFDFAETAKRSWATLGPAHTRGARGVCPPVHRAGPAHVTSQGGPVQTPR